MAASINRKYERFLGTRKYRDEYRTALMEIIEQKAQHKEITTKAQRRQRRPTWWIW